jgi:hypothetical protein
MMRIFPPQPQRQARGFIILTVLIMALLLSSMGIIGAELLVSNQRFGLYETRSAQALNVAEAGVNYYLWHLSHNSADYKDGGSTPATAPYGPYVHNQYDNDGNLLGTYTLYITPPTGGSTVTTVKSIGQVPHFSGTRTILAQLGQPSFANYALLSAGEVWFGSTESSSGPVQSNTGVRFDGTNNGTVYSASTTYKPTVQGGGDGANHPGVWGSGGPQSQWQYPVPAVDFAQITANLSSLSAQATSSGTNLATTNALGYYLLLKPTGFIDYYKVTNENSGGITKTLISTDNAAPGNGVLFVNDNVWVEGVTWPGRITIVAAKLPDQAATNKSINIVGNLTYKLKDGSNAIGLIAQKDIRVSDYAPTTIEIDAALLAQKGNVWVANTAPVKTSLTFYGAIALAVTWTWNWVSSSNGPVTHGYTTTSTSFDSNLIYAPPPLYPTTGNYSVLNWREQLYNP